MHTYAYTMRHTNTWTHIHIQAYIHIHIQVYIHILIHTYTERERTLVRGHTKIQKEVEGVLPNTWHVKDGWNQHKPWKDMEVLSTGFLVSFVNWVWPKVIWKESFHWGIAYIRLTCLIVGGELSYYICMLYTWAYIYMYIYISDEYVWELLIPHNNGKRVPPICDYCWGIVQPMVGSATPCVSGWSLAKKAS